MVECIITAWNRELDGVNLDLITTESDATTVDRRRQRDGA